MSITPLEGFCREKVFGAVAKYYGVPFIRKNESSQLFVSLNKFTDSERAALKKQASQRYKEEAKKIREFKSPRDIGECFDCLYEHNYAFIKTFGFYKKIKPTPIKVDVGASYKPHDVSVSKKQLSTEMNRIIRRRFKIAAKKGKDFFHVEYAGSPMYIRADGERLIISKNRVGELA